MRLPLVLGAGELPEEELLCAALDGELFRIGGAFCPVDTVIGAHERATVVRHDSPDWAIAERYTAAWIYGVHPTFPRPLELCVDSRTRMHPVSDRLREFREVVLTDAETLAIGPLSLTTPLRTAIDIVRFAENFTAADRELILGLGACGGFGEEDCVASMAARRNLPNKKIALQRLRAVFAEH